jgi:ribosomal-protein-alanine N-acetyltransferase
MTEALDAFIDFLFSTGIHKVICMHILENKASGRVMQKCGMIPEDGIRREELYYNGKYCDLKAYYKLNSR